MCVVCVCAGFSLRGCVFVVCECVVCACVCVCVCVCVCGCECGCECGCVLCDSSFDLALPRGHMESTETLPLVGVPTGLDQQKGKCVCVLSVISDGLLFPWTGQRRHMYDREYLLQLRSKLVCQVPPLEILLKECYKKKWVWCFWPPAC